MGEVRCSSALMWVLFCSASAQAQVLSFVGLPTDCGATPSGPLRVVRTGDTTLDLAVDVSVSGGDWAPNPASNGWSNPLTVTIQAGQTVSSAVWLRCAEAGMATVVASAPGLTAANATLPTVPLFFGDDFEGTRLLLTQSPPGGWAGLNTAFGSTFLSGAAHRGGGALRSVDTDTIAGHQLVAYAEQRLVPFQGELFLRGWVRLVSSSEDDQLSFFKCEEPNFAAGHWALNLFPGGVLEAAVWLADGGYRSQQSDAGVLPTGSWVLLEVDYLGAQTTDGGVRLRVNGSTVAEVAHADIQNPALACAGLSVGTFYNQDGRGRFVFDWDDLRFGATPHGQSLQVQVPGPVTVGQCTPLQISLRDAAGALRGAPYNASLAVVGAPLFSESGCQTAARPVLARGVDSLALFTRFDSVVPVAVVVSHPDFLPGSAQVAPLAVSVDAGAPDAGSADAGALDGGALDAGRVDAGPVDAGPTTARYEVGCGCAGAPDASVLLLALGLAVARRARLARRRALG